MEEEIKKEFEQLHKIIKIKDTKKEYTFFYKSFFLIKLMVIFSSFIYILLVSIFYKYSLIEKNVFIYCSTGIIAINIIVTAVYNISGYTTIGFLDNKIICRKGLIKKIIFDINDKVLIFSTSIYRDSEHDIWGNRIYDSISIQSGKNDVKIIYNNNEMNTKKMVDLLNNFEFQTIQNGKMERLNLNQHEKNVVMLEQWDQFLGSRKKIIGFRECNKTININTGVPYFAISIFGATSIAMLIFLIISIATGSLPFVILCLFWEMVFAIISYRIHKKSLCQYKITNDNKLVIGNEVFYSGYEMLNVYIKKNTVWTTNVDGSNTEYTIVIQSNNNYNYVTASTANIKQVFELLNCFIYEN